MLGAGADAFVADLLTRVEDRTPSADRRAEWKCFPAITGNYSNGFHLVLPTDSVDSTGQ